MKVQGDTIAIGTDNTLAAIAYLPRNTELPRTYRYSLHTLQRSHRTLYLRNYELMGF